MRCRPSWFLSTLGSKHACDKNCRSSVTYSSISVFPPYPIPSSRTTKYAAYKTRNVFWFCPFHASFVCVSGCFLQVGTSVLVWAGVAVGWLICNLLPSVLPLYVWSGKSLCGRAGCRSLMPVPHCMFSAGRCVFWCPLAGAESAFCGRNGQWKGLIFRHNRVFVQNQGAVLKNSSLREVHPGDFPSRQGENERRPISCAHSSWIRRSTLLCRKMTRVHPVVSFSH